MKGAGTRKSLPSTDYHVMVTVKPCVHLPSWHRQRKHPGCERNKVQRKGVIKFQCPRELLRGVAVAGYSARRNGTHPPMITAKHDTQKMLYLSQKASVARFGPAGHDIAFKKEVAFAPSLRRSSVQHPKRPPKSVPKLGQSQCHEG